MKKTITVITVAQPMTCAEVEAVKYAFNMAACTGKPPLLNGGMDVKTIEIDDGDVLRCAYCFNPLEQCGCGASVKQSIMDSREQ